MTAPSPKQIDFIRSLCSERRSALSANPPKWLKTPETVRDASNIIALLKAVPRDPVAVDENLAKQVNELRAILDNLDTSNAGFASSLIGQFDERGRLSDKQVACIDRLIEQATTPSKPLDVGLYILDGETVAVVKSKAGRLYTMRLVGNSYEYAPSLIDGLTIGHKMTAEQATAHGKRLKCCVKCFKGLTDTRSRAVWYGETCARNHGWYYPTLEEAYEIHRNDPDHVCSSPVDGHCVDCRRPATDHCDTVSH